MGRISWLTLVCVLGAKRSLETGFDFDAFFRFHSLGGWSVVWFGLVWMIQIHIWIGATVWLRVFGNKKYAKER